MHQLGDRTVELEGGPTLRFAKIALSIKNGRSFSIRVSHAEDEEGREQVARIAWSNSVRDDLPVEEIAVERCFPGDSSWSVYPGGIWTEGAGCIELTVIPNGSLLNSDAFTLRVPLEAACPSKQ